MEELNLLLINDAEIDALWGFQHDHSYRNISHKIAQAQREKDTAVTQDLYEACSAIYEQLHTLFVRGQLPKSGIFLPNYERLSKALLKAERGVNK